MSDRYQKGKRNTEMYKKLNNNNNDFHYFCVVLPTERKFPRAFSSIQGDRKIEFCLPLGIRVKSARRDGQRHASGRNNWLILGSNPKSK